MTYDGESRQEADMIAGAWMYGAAVEQLMMSQIAVALVAVVIVLGYAGAPLWLWSVVVLVASWLLGAPPVVLAITLGVVALLNVRPVRRVVLTSPLVGLMRKINLLPEISETERVALEAGTTWVDGELFSGNPNVANILKNEAYPKLTADEQAFLDGPVERLCEMLDDWQICTEREFTEEVWSFIKKEKFFGLIIPKSYGGLGFSALGHSAVVGKIASRSGAVSTTIIVPNSLGPAELLLHYGTDKQKDYYLPRLADGREIPCFGLTELEAGSDAGSMRSYGVVFKDANGDIKIRMHWQKRYITLAAISTVIGLAFRLKDPDHILSEKDDLGITCALIPSQLSGVKLGRRHDPLGIPFYNCPTEGDGVVISLDDVIGGREGVGRGWQMLMESLAAGRSVSLPAQSTGGAKLAARYIGNYAVARRQFGMSVAQFEGVQEPLGRIGGMTYLLEAARIFTCGAVDQGAKPSVISAIVKYHFTESMRHILTDAMDVAGGAAISRGPRNLLSNMYQGAPIGVTVEGSNILTRSMIIFGQGAIRCHPYAYAEVKALAKNDIAAFDVIFFKHLGLIVRNLFRSVVHAATRGALAGSGGARFAGRHVRRLEWASATFAFLSDVAMGSYGGRLKIKESVTSRFADALSWMYLALAVIKRFETEGGRSHDRAYFEWAMAHCFEQVQKAFDAIFGVIEVPGLTWLFRGPVRLWFRLSPFGKAVTFEHHQRVAVAMTKPGPARNSLTEGIFFPKGPSETLSVLEKTVDLMTAAEAPLAAIRKAVRRKELPKGPVSALLDQAVDKRIISAADAALIRQAESTRIESLKVDEFTLEDYRRLGGSVSGVSNLSPVSGISA
jgi:acyl-CoA dehydrogenase